MVSSQLDMIDRSKAPTIRRIAKMILAAIAAIFLIWVGVGVALLNVSDSNDDVGDVDAVVVLGCRVLPSGEPSKPLRRRAELGAQRALAQNVPLVLTGGTGEQDESEARVASRVALELGVPSNQIRLEEKSTSTFENSKFVAADYPYKRVEIVTDHYHAFRARRVFENDFDDVAVQTVDTDFPGVVWATGREVLAVGWYALRGRL